MDEIDNGGLSSFYQFKLIQAVHLAPVLQLHVISILALLDDYLNATAAQGVSNGYFSFGIGPITHFDIVFLEQWSAIKECTSARYSPVYSVE